MRLTKEKILEKNMARAFSGEHDEQFYRQMRNELLDYKRIEEELGIDLITLFKALNNPVYIKKNYDGTIIDETLWCSNRLYGAGIGSYFLAVDDYILYLEDYGKTWALTKEELL